MSALHKKNGTNEKIFSTTWRHDHQTGREEADLKKSEKFVQCPKSTNYFEMEWDAVGNLTTSFIYKFYI